MKSLDHYEKEVLGFSPEPAGLPRGLCVSSEPGGLSTWYAPFEYINESAKIVLCGITPGLQQANAALQAASDSLCQGDSIATAQMKAKATGSFAGVMRNNLAAMLDSIGIHRLVEIESCSELFGQRADLVHYTSALRNPVLKNGSNYSGDAQMLRSPYLWDQVLRGLSEEASTIPNALWVPLGPAVSAVFEKLISIGVIRETHCLLGLPHASEANAERIKYFLGEKSREELSSKTSPDLLDQRKQSLVLKVETLLKGESPVTARASVPAVDCPVPKSSDPAPEETSAPKGKLYISATVSRGKHKGSTLLPHRHPEAENKFVVSKTRFSKDYIYLDTLGDVPDYLEKGYGLRMSMPDSGVAPSLVVPGSIRVQSNSK